MIAWLAATAGAATRVRLAIVMSTNEGLPHEEPLRYADQDAARVARMLHEVGGHAPGNVWVLPSAEVEDLYAILAQVTARASDVVDAGGSVRLMMFYAGHAGPDGLHLSGETLPLPDLKSAIRVVPAEQRVVVIDACHAGTIARSRGATLLDLSDGPIGFAPPPNEAWITSSGPEERSFEVDDRRGALFTHFFLSGARGAADADGDHDVDLGEIYRFVQAHTSAAAADLGQLQQPRWGGELASVPLSNIADSPTGVRLPGPIASPLLLIHAGGEKVVAEVPAGGGANLALPPGSYQVVALDPGAVKVGHLEIPEDSWTLWSSSAELGRATSVRTRGGLYDTRPWRAGAAYRFTLGMAEGGTDAHGAALVVGRALGRGHVLDLAGGFTLASWDTSYWSGNDTTIDLTAQWTREIFGTDVVLAPGAALTGSWTRHAKERTEHAVFGEWYGDRSAAEVDVAPAIAAEAGAVLRVKLSSRLRTDVWVGGGAAWTDPPADAMDPSLKPVASGRLAIWAPFR